MLMYPNADGNNDSKFKITRNLNLTKTQAEDFKPPRCLAQEAAKMDLPGNTFLT